MPTFASIRSNKSRRLAKLALGAFIVVISIAFIFGYGWQPTQGDGAAQERMVVMTVNGEPFHIYEIPNYRREYAPQMLGPQAAQLREQDLADIIPDDVVLDQAIIDILLTQQASERGLALGPDDQLDAVRQFTLQFLSQEQLQQLQATPNAQEQLNGLFANIASQLYRYDGQTMVNHIVERSLRDRAANVLLYPQARTSILELWQAYEQNRTQYRLACAVFEIGQEIDTAAIASEEVVAYYEDHPEEFLRGEQYIWEHVSVRLSNLQNEVEVTPGDVTAEYEANNDQWTRPAVYDLTLLRVDTPEGEEGPPEELEEIVEAVAAGEDFDLLVQEYSVDPSAALGGNIVRNEDRLDPAVIEALSQTATGEVTEPIQIGTSWLLYRFNGFTPAVVTPLEAVAAEIRSNLRRQQADRRFAEYEDEFLSANSTFTSLDDISDALGLETQVSAPTPPDATFIPGVGTLGIWAERLENLEVGMIFEEVINTGSALAIVRLADVSRPQVAPLDDALEQRIRLLLARRQAEEAAESAALTLREAALTAPRVRSGEFFTPVAMEEDLDLPLDFTEVTTDTFQPATGVIPNVGNVPALPRLLHYSPVDSLSDVEPMRAENSNAIAGYVVWLVQERVAPERSAFYADLLQQRAQVLRENQNRLLTEWAEDVTNAPDVQIERRDLAVR